MGGALAQQSNELRHDQCHFALGFLEGSGARPEAQPDPPTPSPLPRCPRCPAGLRRFPSRTDIPCRASRPGPPRARGAAPLGSRARPLPGLRGLGRRSQLRAPTARLVLSGRAAAATCPGLLLLAASLFPPPCSLFCPTSVGALTLLYQKRFSDRILLPLCFSFI